MRIITFLLFLTLLSKHYFGQHVSSTKQQILKAFKESINPDQQNEWLTCNEDSAFFKAKIVRLYNHINYLYDPQHCCNHIGWKFISTEKFDLQQTLICQEPPLGIILQDAIYQVDVLREKHGLLLTISNSKHRTKFKVVSLDKAKLWNGINESLVLNLERID